MKFEWEKGKKIKHQIYFRQRHSLTHIWCKRWNICLRECMCVYMSGQHIVRPYMSTKFIKKLLQFGVWYSLFLCDSFFYIIDFCFLPFLPLLKCKKKNWTLVPQIKVMILIYYTNLTLYTLCTCLNWTSMNTKKFISIEYSSLISSFFSSNRFGEHFGQHESGWIKS